MNRESTIDRYLKQDTQMTMNEQSIQLKIGISDLDGRLISESRGMASRDSFASFK